MRLAELVAASMAIAATSSRRAKVEHLAAALRSAGPAEVGLAVGYLAGEPRQRRTGVGWAALRERPAPAAAPSLGLVDVDTALERLAALAGPGSQTQRREALAHLLGRATADEQRFLVALLTGELRQGALEALVVEALARAAELPLPDVRRAVMLAGELPAVAGAALSEGAPGLARFGLRVGRPILAMLAQSAATVGEALERTGPAAVEWKLDGVRVQVHCDGGDVGVYTRSLDDITDRLPEVVAAAKELPLRAAVLDGEVLALRSDGRPEPFQLTASRVGTRRGAPGSSRAGAGAPLALVIFDLLHLDGEDVLGRPLAGRHEALVSAVPAELRVQRTVAQDASAAQRWMDDALAHGHEGVVVKSLDAPYEAGRRGAGWVKVKPRHTLDLVVLAAEWGHGRRQGWLSNLHLGALDDSGGPPVMLGKTFKGLTDAMLAWQTQHLLGLATSPADAWVVAVRPELVVEIAFDGVQTSSRYPAGMALRFARVLRHRPDKRAAEADTVAAVRALHEMGR